jgi:hypothetical protein
MGPIKPQALPILQQHSFNIHKLQHAIKLRLCLHGCLQLLLESSVEEMHDMPCFRQDRRHRVYKDLQAALM